MFQGRVIALDRLSSFRVRSCLSRRHHHHSTSRMKKAAQVIAPMSLLDYHPTSSFCKSTRGAAVCYCCTYPLRLAHKRSNRPRETLIDGLLPKMPYSRWLEAILVYDKTKLTEARETTVCRYPLWGGENGLRNVLEIGRAAEKHGRMTKRRSESRLREMM